MKVTKNQSVAVLCPAGTHVAIINRVLDYGTQKQGKFGDKPTVYIGVETPDEVYEFKEGEGEKPFTIGTEFNRTLGSDSNLGKAVAGILARPLTEDEETNGIDLEELNGKLIMITVQHAISKEKKRPYAKIVGWAPVLKSEKRKLKPVNELITIDLDPETFDQVEFNKLPTWQKKKIAGSPEYKEVGEPVLDNPGQSAEDKELPFVDNDSETEAAAGKKGNSKKVTPAPTGKGGKAAPKGKPTAPAKGRNLFK